MNMLDPAAVHNAITEIFGDNREITHYEDDVPQYRDANPCDAEEFAEEVIRRAHLYTRKNGLVGETIHHGDGEKYEMSIEDLRAAIRLYTMLRYTEITEGTVSITIRHEPIHGWAIDAVDGTGFSSMSGTVESAKRLNHAIHQLDEEWQ